MGRENESVKFRIKHEDSRLLVAVAISAVFFMFCLMFGAMFRETEGSKIWAVPVLVISMVAMFFLGVLYLVHMLLGATIRVGDDEVTIRTTFGKKKIAIKDISSVYVDHFHRNRRRRREYRLRMRLYSFSHKPLELTDNASEINGIVGFITGERTQLMDVNIPLYQAYELIKEKVDALKPQEPEALEEEEEELTF